MNNNFFSKNMVFWLILLGLLTGFASSFLGIGGGVILVPGLLFLGIEIKKAIGTSLAGLIFISAVGVIIHFFINPANINFYLAFLFLIGGIFGSKIGAVIVKKINPKNLMLFFALFLIFISLSVLNFLDFSIFGNVKEYFLVIIISIFFGFFGGLTSSLFGVGGGAIYVPVLSVLFGFSMHQAIPTSLLTITLTTLFGAFFHKKINTLDLSAAKIIIPSGIIGAIIGAICSSFVPSPNLKSIFGIFLIFVSIYLIFKFFKSKKDA